METRGKKFAVRLREKQRKFRNRENTGNIAIFVSEFPIFSEKPNVSAELVSHIKQSQITLHTQGKFAVRQGKNREYTENLKFKFEWDSALADCSDYRESFSILFSVHPLYTV